MSSASIEEVRNRLDIVDVISETVPLKKAGRTFKAPCPFHNERTPSFIVNPDRQTWHCFGACSTGGNVFSFVMKRENMEFGETLRILAEKVGVALPTRDQAAESKTDRLLEANKAAAAFFQSQLLTSPAAAPTRDYIKRRGLSGDVVKEFQLGYCPPTSGALFRHLQSLGFTMDECADAGLGTHSESGEVRDIFRGRLMFPIRDPRGRVIGFGGRALGESGPKYINSPQSSLFDKSGVLYAADRAREAARQANRVVVVEGYMDVITAHQFGFRNVVASMGTALTEKQVDVLKRLSRRISLALDADAAGQEATLRSLKSSWQSFYRSVHPLQGSNRRRFLEGPTDHVVDIVSLPKGEDPDSIIRKDREGWESLLESPKPLIDYLMETEVERANLDSPGARAAILEEFRSLLVTTDFLDQEVYVRKLANLMQVAEETVKAAINAPSPARMRRPQPPSPSRRSQQGQQPTPASRQKDVMEEYVLGVLLKRPDLLAAMDNPNPEWFIDPINREIFERVASGGAMEDLGESWVGEKAEVVERLIRPSNHKSTDDDMARGLRECAGRLESRRLKRLKQAEALALGDGEALGDTIEAIRGRALAINEGLKKIQEKDAAKALPHKGV